MDEHNPLIPAGYDIAWSVITAILIALTVVALISLMRSVKRLTGAQAMVWTLLIILIPLLGSVAWLAIGRRTLRIADSGSSSS